MERPLVSLSSDFGPGNRGIGVMRATVLEICPEAQVIDLVHDIEGCNIKDGAKLFESVGCIPAGYHVCVVDPGVGTTRHGIAIETDRGDVLIGPDNGVLIPTSNFLGGIKRVHALENEKYQKAPASPVFHGRDIFAAAAAHLAAGVEISELGEELSVEDLIEAPYKEALYQDGTIQAEVISLHKVFGNASLNVCREEMHKVASAGDDILFNLKNKQITIPYRKTFGEVDVGSPVIFDDAYRRVEVAINQGNFAREYDVNVGDAVTLNSK